ncbi:uncharacterized protein METZ01_LOCUS86626 [marine metagenome]|uniref:Uncharacterized protein n=1 Tax=marine metagenome TaxID=408172 RepID=A0A381V067_9ZZZZ|tara:strand:- start:356 stop:520 length:165 start_codon:yes stop_codon:yes gene_type:complete
MTTELLVLYRKTNEDVVFFRGSWKKIFPKLFATFVLCHWLSFLLFTPETEKNID